VTAWPALVECALLGTARRPVPDAGGGELGPLLAGDDADPAERRLLRRAGVLGVYRRAGALPATALAQRTGAPAPPETRPACSRAAAHDAADILADGLLGAALPEWLALVAERGLVAPPPLLPGLLDAAGGRDDLVAPVLAVLGERGRWLGAHRADWQWAASDAAARWPTTAGAVRRRLLLAARAEDPAGGRALLESTWEEESARDREQYVALLAAGLSAADEPLLERALADRSKGVRVAAAAVLAALPSSRFAARMAERLRALVRCERRALEVALPKPDDELAAAGIGDGPPPGVGAGAWRLEQLVAAAPLSFWEQACGRPPERIVGLDVAGNLRAAVHGGWARAAVRQGSRPWATALLAAGETDPALRVELLRAAGGAAAEDAALAPGAGAFIPHVPPPWSPDFTVAAFDRALDAIHAPEVLRALGRRGDPAALDRLYARVDALDAGDALEPRFARDAAGALTLLDFRRRMRANLTETG